jgi:GT2 family glycosyltransferase
LKDFAYFYFGFAIRNTASYKHWRSVRDGIDKATRPITSKQAQAEREVRAVEGSKVKAPATGARVAATSKRWSDENPWADYTVLSQRIKAYQAEVVSNARPHPVRIVSVNPDSIIRLAAKLTFPRTDRPSVSIIIPVYNNIKYTVECLLSVYKHSGDVTYEVIVVDDGSTDETKDVLAQVRNITYVRNHQNLGFLRACNRGAKKARGQYLLFLNNDAQATKGWLKALIETFNELSGVGAVGPKMLYANGRLQEAGARINRDGSSQLIGVSDDPTRPRYNYSRDVDYCSGACLVVETERFRMLGGFDQSLAPAYCEDIDLCFRIRQAGLQVIYNPKSVVVHHLSITSNAIDKSYKLQCVTQNQQEIAERWQEKIDSLNDVRLIAFYLPQFHPIPENDRWWGTGFTEWANVTKARPNFDGHYQPRLPGDLGFYDLRMVEVMEQQSELAKNYSIYGFCYYYYWFGGKRLLEMPLERMLKTDKPDIPFCLCWANENWTRRWDGREQDILVRQVHSAQGDRAVMLDIIRYMHHRNYIRINGKPLLLIYRVSQFPDIKRTTDMWRDLCHKEGIGEIYLAMVESFENAYSKNTPSQYGFDASVEFPPHGTEARTEPPGRILNPEYKGSINDYRKLALKYIARDIPSYTRFRTVLTSWDNTPRQQHNSYIFAHATPGAYQAWLEALIRQTREQNFGEERIIFINAWNEWAEGAYLEPDQRFGHGYLEATRNAMENYLLKTI